MTDAESSEFGQMVVAELPERLPLGWTEKVGSKDGEEVKFYYNGISGKKFYSKADVFHYVELGSPSQGTRQRTRAQNEGKPENIPLLMPAVTDNTPEWLPPGWIVELNAVNSGRKYRTYIDPSTGRKFHSKPEIVKYLNSDECTDPMSKQIAMSIVSSSSNVLPAALNNTAENPPEWLPQGWIMELKIRSNGRKFKRYIDSSTGQKCYSKPEVMTYLSSGKSKEPTFEQTALSTFSDAKAQKPQGSQSIKITSSISRPKQMRSSTSQKKTVEVVRYEEEKLPPGWIKEIKFERTGNKIRRDPFYTDPDSKYVFRSVRDALRYLETKDIRACAMRPKKREELEFLIDDKSLHVSEENQMCLLDNNTTEKHTGKEENKALTSGQLQSTPGSKRKRGRPVAAPSPNNIMPQEKQTEVIIDYSTNSDSVQAITAAARDNDVKGEEPQNQPLQRLGDDSTLYPCLEFAFKTLRGDVPVESNNIDQQRASVNVGLPSFSYDARRQM